MFHSFFLFWSEIAPNVLVCSFQLAGRQEPRGRCSPLLMDLLSSSAAIGQAERFQRNCSLMRAGGTSSLQDMKYISTRGGVSPVEFRQAVMMGMADDGGLLLPESIPDVTERLEAWRELHYEDLAFEILRLFADLEDETLRSLISRSYETFRHPHVTPVTQVGNVHVLELFHGPTLAFKDIALQLLGNLFELLLEASGGRLNIVAATSGDTGSAAICGVRGKERIRIFVMHPHKRTSPIQAMQMTTVLDDNVFNLAVEGTFDDCQSILKALFNDLRFKDAHRLGSVNSINWARLLAQVVYYFFATFRVMEQTGATSVRFAVPTGNFGDIFAGYLARRMGLPISQLILATNENDILARFFSSGDYSLSQVVPTLSPSMDIQVASNFERYLYYRVGEDADALKYVMSSFAENGALDAALLPPFSGDDGFVAGSGDRSETLRTIRDVHANHGYLLDPHTAVGVHVAQRFLDDDEPMICLATAHPAKFPDAIRDATGREDLAHHPLIDALSGLDTRVEVLPADVPTIRDFVAERT